MLDEYHSAPPVLRLLIESAIFAAVVVGLLGLTFKVLGA